jgi:hypothetical protein
LNKFKIEDNSVFSYDSSRLLHKIAIGVLPAKSSAQTRTVVATENQHVSYTLMPFDELFAAAGLKDTPIDLFALDMDGDEWMAVEAMLRANSLQNIKQITMQSRLGGAQAASLHVVDPFWPVCADYACIPCRFYYGEENEVSRSYYSMHKSLTWAGFVQFWHRRIAAPTFGRAEYASHCQFPTCFEIGYVNTKFDVKH